MGHVKVSLKFHGCSASHFWLFFCNSIGITHPSHHAYFCMIQSDDCTFNSQVFIITFIVIDTLHPTEVLPARNGHDKCLPKYIVYFRFVLDFIIVHLHLFLCIMISPFFTVKKRSLICIPTFCPSLSHIPANRGLLLICNPYCTKFISSISSMCAYVHTIAPVVIVSHSGTWVKIGV